MRHLLLCRLLMNNVNSISQMNSVVCEHSSLMGHEAKKGPMMGGGENGPDGNIKAALRIRSAITWSLFFHNCCLCDFLHNISGVVTLPLLIKCQDVETIRC